MPRSKKKDNREEILQQKVGPGGTSSPALDAMLSDKFVGASNVEASQIAAAVVQLFGTQLEQQNQVLSRIMERMDKMDKESEKYEEDRKAWRDEVLKNAERLRLADEQREQLQAKAMLNVEQKIQEARAAIKIDRKQFEKALSQEPKVQVVSGGKTEIVMEGGVPVAKLYPEELRVKHLRFILMPGVPTMLPKSIADAWERRRQSALETQERQAALRKNLESDKLAAEMERIDKKYGSSTARLGQDDSQIYVTK